uniref:CP2 domain-containing protein n=1 Tax=Elaeophora elaphi TaxID=1147741 RepID=A0A0R3RVL4_9BILA
MESDETMCVMMLSACDLLPGPAHENEDEGSIWQSKDSSTLSRNTLWRNTPAPASTLEFILMAPTSAEMPLHEQPVTFLDQNRPYDFMIRCRKSLEPWSHVQELLYKTVITICFHNKKLRHQMNDLTKMWKTKNPRQRFFTLDMPRCSNVSHVKYALRSAEFVWDGSLPNASVFIKFSVLSSDFVDSCGEKGEPFRLVFQTYRWGSSKLLQQNSSLIQIFKLRGAERKRTERKKAIMHANQEQYQPSYDYAFLLSADFDYTVDDEERVTPAEQVHYFGNALGRGGFFRFPTALDDIEQVMAKRHCSVGYHTEVRICTNHSAVFVTKWLKSHRFINCAYIFENYSGEDILRLGVLDLTSLIGDKPEVLRLFHALRKKATEPHITIYMAIERSSIYNMVKLYEGTLDELKEKIKKMTGITVRQIFVRGPRGILICVTDQVIESWQNQSIFRAVQVDNEYMLMAEM